VAPTNDELNKRKSDTPITKSIALVVFTTFLGMIVTGVYKIFSMSSSVTALEIRVGAMKELVDRHHIQDRENLNKLIESIKEVDTKSEQRKKEVIELYQRNLNRITRERN
jgi:hypothetical protein